MEPQQRLAKEIRAELIRQDLTPADLAEALGLSQPTTARRLKGAAPFRVDELIELTSLLDVTVEELLSRADAQRGGRHVQDGSTPVRHTSREEAHD